MPTATRYPGQYFDVESGLYYNYFRSYNPTSGTYSQGDPIGLLGGWNRRTYALNNAVNYSDPTGLIVGVDDLAVGGVVITTGCLLSPGCRAMVGNAMSTAADAAGSAASAAVSAVKNFCSPGAPDPCKGLRDQLNAHEKKLQNYVNDPLGSSDNTSILNWAVLGGNGAAASSIYEGRIRNLKGQIENFRKLLQECERKNGQP